MKKNTLLYLDSEIVQRAKTANINISRLTEEALLKALDMKRPETAKEYLREC